MVKEAEEHASDDKQKRELAEARNQGEALIHQTEKTIKDLGDKAPAGEKSAAETAITALREKLTGEDPEPIKSATEALAQVSMKLGEALYKAQQGDAAAAGTDAGGPQAGAPKSDDGIVDADFEEVKDDKNKKSA